MGEKKENKAIRGADLDSLVKQILDMIMIADRSIMTEEDFKKKWIEIPEQEKLNRHIQYIVSAIEGYHNMIEDQREIINKLENTCVELNEQLKEQSEQLKEQSEQLEQSHEEKKIYQMQAEEAKAALKIAMEQIAALKEEKKQLTQQ